MGGVEAHLHQRVAEEFGEPIPEIWEPFQVQAARLQLSFQRRQCVGTNDEMIRKTIAITSAANNDEVTTKPGPPPPARWRDLHTVEPHRVDPVRRPAPAGSTVGVDLIEQLKPTLDLGAKKLAPALLVVV
ncbi:MAG: hypothetical protein ACE149_14800 [Armatimonadota bacterium]